MAACFFVQHNNAVRDKMARFKIVCGEAARGCLPAGFLNPETRQRPDRQGGCLEIGTRLLRAKIADPRKSAGDRCAETMRSARDETAGVDNQPMKCATGRFRLPQNGITDCLHRSRTRCRAGQDQRSCPKVDNFLLILHENTKVDAEPWVLWRGGGMTHRVAAPTTAPPRIALRVTL